MTKMPSAWIKASASKLTSRINMSAEVAGKGMCPECKAPMQVVHDNGRKVWACAKDRITLPMPNQS